MSNTNQLVKEISNSKSKLLNRILFYTKDGWDTLSSLQKASCILYAIPQFLLPIFHKSNMMTHPERANTSLVPTIKINGIDYNSLLKIFDLMEKIAKNVAFL